MGKCKILKVEQHAGQQPKTEGFKARSSQQRPALTEGPLPASS